MKKRKWITLITIIWLTSMNTVTASESVPVQTEGTIGFTGIYEPEGTPDPKPPMPEVARPVGTLPQTNTVENTRIVLIGILIASISFLLWKRKRHFEKNK